LQLPCNSAGFRKIELTAQGVKSYLLKLKHGAKVRWI
jgi:hypothetical protein